MILNALNDYYDRLAEDPEQDVAPYGFSRQKISFCVVLDTKGNLVLFEPLGETQGKKFRPKTLIVPGQSKPSGSGINPCFLWDNGAYLLGFKPDDPKPARTRESFVAFCDRHLALEEAVDDPTFSTVCRFLQQWNPDEIEVHVDTLTGIAGSFGVFRIKGKHEYAHERPKIEAYWRGICSDSADDEVEGMCLVRGVTSPIARLHEPKIKGVDKAQSSGALLVSFNEQSYTSYGKSQSFNAPVSELAAFKYTTALNKLLADQKRRVIVGDATIVFWTERPTPAEDVMAAMFQGEKKDDSNDAPTEDVSRVKDVGLQLQRLRQGTSLDEEELAGTQFYVLGLSPNASRISVRYWLTGTLGELYDRLERHVRDLDIHGPDRVHQPPSFRDILDETVPTKNGWPDRAKVPSLLAGELARAVLTGGRYPDALAHTIIRRMRTEGFVNREKRKNADQAEVNRAAFLKAWLIRNKQQEVSVMLNPEHPSPAYQLGRLFAVLEKIQVDALGQGLNSTIKDRFFGAASATPTTVFPRLMTLTQHHLNKIENPGLRIIREKEIGAICGHLDAFPRHLPLEDQGLFHLGYYHQNRDLWTKKKPTAADNEMNNTD